MPTLLIIDDNAGVRTALERRAVEAGGKLLDGLSARRIAPARE